MSASIVDKRTPKWRDQSGSLRTASTAAPDDVDRLVHARYARIAAVRVGIRFAGDPDGLAEVTAALGLAVA